MNPLNALLLDIINADTCKVTLHILKFVAYIKYFLLLALSDNEVIVDIFQ